MRNRYFVDTGFLIALAAPQDQLHGSAALLAQKIRNEHAALVTTRAVLLELGAALSGLRYRSVAATMLRMLGGDRIVHGHSIIASLTGQDCAQVDGPLLYAGGLALAVDGGRYAGGPLLLVRM